MELILIEIFVRKVSEELAYIFPPAHLLCQFPEFRGPDPYHHVSSLSRDELRLEISVFYVLKGKQFFSYFIFYHDVYLI